MTAMQLRRAGRWLGFTILTAALVHVATVWLLPQLTAKSALGKAEVMAGFNRIIHLDGKITADPLVPRPDPATLESVCAFDITGGAVRLTLPADAPAMTVTVTANNAVQFYASSPDSSTGSIIVASERQAQLLEGEIAISPGGKGLILVRIMAIDPATRERAEAARQQLDCGYAS